MCTDMEKRKCSDCKTIKTIENFSKDKSSVGGYSYRCKPCSKTHYEKLKVLEPNNFKKYSRKAHLKHKYGVSEKWYEDKLNEQNNTCAICNTEPADMWKGSVCYLAVDHNHITQQPRGLLCKKCNSAIGQLNDDILLLQRAIDYLKYYE